MNLSDRLQLWQKDLIDISRRNALLYYSDIGRGAGIRLCVDDSATFFARLTRTGHPIGFDDVPTDLEPDQLARRLARLRSHAREDLQERGIHTLYVAFGLLAWRELVSSAEVTHSPLILVPVTLKRLGLAGPFELGLLGNEETVLNPALREVLHQQFGLRLSAYEALAVRDSTDSEEYATSERAAAASRSLEDMLRAIQEEVRGHDTWEVLPEVHLSRFSFQKLAMYDDLRRNEGSALAHGILRALCGDRIFSLQPTEALRADQLDEHVRPHDMVEILDADSSQQEAIALAKGGASFVLQGPPGTGKSQTIANIIAACLGLGKRVLFVSEKMAALQVVRQRLHDFSIGEYCLDLHDPHRDKKVFIGELRDALAAARVPAPRSQRDWQYACDQLEQERAQLNLYVRELHQPRFALGITAFEVLGELARLADVPDLDAAIEHFESVTPLDFSTMKHALAELTEYGDVLEAPDSYPWHDITVTTFSLALEANIRDHFGRFVAELHDYEASIRDLMANVGEAPDDPSFARATHTCHWLERALEGPRPPRHWLQPNEIERVLSLAQHAADRWHEFMPKRAQLDARYSYAVRQLDHQALLVGLTSDAEQAIRALYAPSPYDTALRQRTEISSRLCAARAALDHLSASALAVSETLGLDAPLSPRDAARILDWADCVLATPTPPGAWLDPSQYAVIRATGIDAVERHSEITLLRERLDAFYDPTFLAQDLPGYALRFKEQYRSWLRIFKPNYHRDCRQLRSRLHPGHTRTAEQLELDLYAAIKVLDGQQWLRHQRLVHARTLGRLFEDVRTDWQRVWLALTWLDSFQGLLGGAEPSAAMSRLVIGPATARSALRVQRARLADAWKRWQTEIASLLELWPIEALVPEVYDADEASIEALDAALASFQQQLARFWTAAEAMEACCTASAVVGTAAETHGAWGQLCIDVAWARDVAAHERWHEDCHESLTTELGSDYKGDGTNWEALFGALQWVRVFVDEYPGRAVPDALARIASCKCGVAERDDLRRRLAQARSSYANIEAELAFAQTVLPGEALLPIGTSSARARIGGVAERVSYHLASLHCLAHWLACRERMERCKIIGLEPVLLAVTANGKFPHDLVSVFERRFYTLWMDGVRKQSEVLRRFQGRTHTAIIARFRTLDGDHKVLARQRLRSLLAETRPVPPATTQANYDVELTEAMIKLRREVEKKRHGSIRHIVNQTERALLALKPCWMMSPLAVSQFVMTCEPIFDIVIFDEASQVCPEDAICTIMRGKQLVVVGDSKQLPPTRFFTKTLADTMEDETDETDDLPEQQRMESILDECLASGFAERELRWHYRSQHEALIAFSNQHFYADHLITFPSPATERTAGVRWVYVEDGVYQRSGSRTNLLEAERVVDEIANHARTGGDLTKLGVVALSEAQQQEIRDVIDRRLRQDLDLCAWEQQLRGEDASGFFVRISRRCRATNATSLS